MIKVSYRSVSCPHRLRGHSTRDTESTMDPPEMTKRYKNLVAYRFSMNDYGSYWHAAVNRVFCTCMYVCVCIVRSRSKRISFPYWILTTTGTTRRRLDDKTTAMRGAWNIDNKYEPRIMRYKSPGSTRYILKIPWKKNRPRRIRRTLGSSPFAQRGRKKKDTPP